jgi:hypothetical protein
VLASRPAPVGAFTSPASGAPDRVHGHHGARLIQAGEAVGHADGGVIPIDLISAV